MNLSHILVPVDFSPTSDHALDAALDLAKKVGAKVTVVHAYEVPVFGLPDGAFIPSADVVTNIVDASRAALDRTVEAKKGAGVPFETLLKAGAASDVVAETAREVGAGLIVMGTHGRRGLAHALLGSVTEKVLRTAPVPVLTIREETPA